MTKTKLKKKVFEPTQVDRLVFQVQDMAEEVYDMTVENEELHGCYEALSQDVQRLEALVGSLQALVNDRTGYTTTYTASVDCEKDFTKPWWKRLLGR